MRIFFSVGEPSGDLHGSNLIRRLKAHDDSIACVGYGGPKMADAGCKLHYELTTMAVMFVSKVVTNLRFFFGLIGLADDYFRENKVDAVVLIDYPGFNWWIARKAKKHNIPVFYYGVPQMWAWAPWRVSKIRRLVDHVLCKLPFEEDWFAARNCRATYVGHPYFDELDQQTYDDGFIESLLPPGEKLLTLLPGSRDQEVENNLPLLLDAAKHVSDAVSDVKIAVACFNEKQFEMAKTLIASRGDPTTAQLFVHRTPELMKTATVCLACSGSVSMELLYHRKPTVIVYQIRRSTMVAQSVILRTRFITLANLIATDKIQKSTWAPYDPDDVSANNADAALMPEYLTVCNPATKVAAHAIRWLTDETSRLQKIADMDRVAKTVAIPGATEKAADYILKQLQPVAAEEEEISEKEPTRVFKRTG